MIILSRIKSMSLIFSYLGLSAVWVSAVCFIFLFFHFGANKKRYNRLIDLYHNNRFLFYTPYHFHSLFGFFGSFTLVYYFLCLLKKKKPVFMWYKNKNVYNFFDGIPHELYKWMHLYYRVTLVYAYSCIFVVLMVLARFINERYFLA
ncbi:hypothetical protein EHW64_04840 [Erwinia psidii]|nr:hypothetical protein [Erwinia psidii]